MSAPVRQALDAFYARIAVHHRKLSTRPASEAARQRAHWAQRAARETARCSGEVKEPAIPEWARARGARTIAQVHRDAIERCVNALAYAAWDEGRGSVGALDATQWATRVEEARDALKGTLWQVAGAR